MYVSPILMKEILSFIEDSSCYPEWYPYFISLLLFVITLGQSTIFQHYINITARLGLHRRTACMGLIFRKSLRIASVNQQQDQQSKATPDQKKSKKGGAAASGTGKLATLMSNDCNKIMLASQYFQNFYWQPMSVIVCMSLLYSIIGVSSFVGFGCLLLLLPIQVLVAKRLASVRKRGLKASGQRVGLVHELLVGIRIIKLLAWEIPFLRQVGGRYFSANCFMHLRPPPGSYSSHIREIIENRRISTRK